MWLRLVESAEESSGDADSPRTREGKRMLTKRHSIHPSVTSLTFLFRGLIICQ